MKRPSLRARGWGLLGIMLIGTLVSSAVTHLVRNELEGSLRDSVTMTTAVHNQATVDMYHDGLRGVVLSALLTQEIGVAHSEVKSELEEISSEIRKLVSDNKALPLGETIRSSLANLDKPLDDYL